MRPALHRFQELLIDRATQGLDAGERRELERILETHPEWDDEGFDLAAAALDLALQRHVPDIPPAVKRRLEARSRTWVPPVD